MRAEDRYKLRISKLTRQQLQEPRVSLLNKIVDLLKELDIQFIKNLKQEKS